MKVRTLAGLGAAGISGLTQVGVAIVSSHRTWTSCQHIPLRECPMEYRAAFHPDTKNGRAFFDSVPRIDPHHPAARLNVSKACKLMGYYRNTFYEVRRAFQIGGVAALVEEKRGPRNPHPDRVAPEIEQKSLAYALNFPTRGPVGQQLWSAILNQDVYMLGRDSRRRHADTGLRRCKHQNR